MIKALCRSVERIVLDSILRREINYRVYLKMRYGAGTPFGYPDICVDNRVLKTREEWVNALKEIRRLRLPPHPDPVKNWDTLAALGWILGSTRATGWILDAGAELYSMMLPWLYLYGYKNMIGNNLIFTKPLRRGPIRYQYGDITKTDFRENTFDAVSCLSVIEHGVDLDAYFREMSRILKPNGILVTSTDYFDTPPSTKGLCAYGAPIHIFSTNEIVSALDLARKYGLEITSPIDLSCGEKPVVWKKFGLQYTFIIFNLRKMS